MRKTLIRLGLSLGLFGLFLLHTSGRLPMRLLDTIENYSYDARILMTLEGGVDPRIVIVDVDEKSLAAEGQFPWPRDQLGALVDQLFDRYQIRALGFDMNFPEPDGKSPHRVLQRLDRGPDAAPAFRQLAEDALAKVDFDQRFAEALRGERVVLGYYFRPVAHADLERHQGQLCPPVLDQSAVRLLGIDFLQPEAYTSNLPVLQSAARSCGFFDNPMLDRDGVTRRVPLLQRFEGQVYPSLALELVRLALDQPPVQFEFDPPHMRSSLHLERVRIGPLSAPVDEHAAVMIPYRGPEGSFPYVSATDVLQGHADPEVLRGALVLVGTSAPGLRDLRATPVARAYSGVEVHANIISGMLDGTIKQKAPYYAGIEAVLLLTIGLVLALAFPRVAPVTIALLTLGLLAAVSALALYLWQRENFVMPLGVPLLFTLVVFLAQVLYGYFIESRSKRAVSRLFGQYVPPQLVEELAARPDAVSMEGEARDMTVLFSDVRGFTSMAENLDARDVATLMNRLLTKQTAVIQKHRGTIDKYMGDAVMAFWGAPLADPQHALSAVLAGMEMVHAVRDLDEEFERRGWPKLHIGVGINTGRMNVGNMGSEFRMAYTVIGDAVNLGSRVEGLTKAYGAPVICTSFTRDQLPSDWAFRELDLVAVKGRREPVAIFEPLGPKERLDPALREDLARHRGALRLYRAQRWDEAEVEFFNLRKGRYPHPVYDVFLKRIPELRASPPGSKWTGAVSITHK